MEVETKTNWESILQAGGVAVAALSVVGLAVSGAFTLAGEGRSAESELAIAKIEAETERLKDAGDEREKLCEELYDFLGDETPNPAISSEAQAAIDDILVQNLRSCTISYGDSFFDDQAAAVPKEVISND